MENTVRKWLEEKGLRRRVHLVGPVKDVGSWLSVMDVFLLTSETEGLPNVVIEAQGFGVPVVSTDAGGVREIIDDGQTGLIMGETNPNFIAEALITALSEEAAGWGEKAEARARELFSAQAMIDSTQRVYLSVLNS